MIDYCSKMEAIPSQNTVKVLKVFQLSIAREEDGIRISAFERNIFDEEMTIHDYEKILAPMSVTPCQLPFINGFTYIVSMAKFLINLRYY